MAHILRVAVADTVWHSGSRAGPDVGHWKDLQSLQQNLNGAVNMFSCLLQLGSNELVGITWAVWLETGAGEAPRLRRRNVVACGVGIWLMRCMDETSQELHTEVAWLRAMYAAMYVAFSEENAPRRNPAALVGFTFLMFSEVIRVLRSEVIVNYIWCGQLLPDSWCFSKENAPRMTLSSSQTAGRSCEKGKC